MTKIVQITSRLPPSVNGVGDYANLLAGTLNEKHGVETEFLVTEPRSEQRTTIPSGSIFQLEDRSSASLSRWLETNFEDSTVILHFVGYAYHKRGCPFWLVNGLEQWKRRKPQQKLIVMFHELFATGPVWSSSFWLSPIQRYLVQRLALTADQCVTSMVAYAKKIGQLAPKHSGKVIVLPVFSNVGEPSSIALLSDRLPELIIFGGGNWLSNARSEQLLNLERICESLRLERIVIIGKSVQLDWQGRVPIEATGVLSADEVSERLKAARVGYLDYFPGYLAKSGVFAAYCSHGLLPIFPNPNPSELDGVRHGETYLTVNDVVAGVSSEQCEAVAMSAREWYSRHTTTIVAQTFSGALAKEPLVPCQSNLQLQP